MNSAVGVAFVVFSFARFGIASDIAMDCESIRSDYSVMETNLLSKYQTTEGREKVHVICALGLIGSEKSFPILLDNIDWSESPIQYWFVRGRRMPIGSVRIVSIDYPSIMALDYRPIPLSEYIDRIEQEEDPKSLRIDLLTVSGYAKHRDAFLEAARERLSSDSNRWSYVLSRADFESYQLSRNDWHFGNSNHWTDPATIEAYARMQTNLLTWASSACAEQNATNLLDIVSTYRFIHAPIPEEVSTNTFFRTVVGGD